LLSLLGSRDHSALCVDLPEEHAVPLSGPKITISAVRASQPHKSKELSDREGFKSYLSDFHLLSLQIINWKLSTCVPKNASHAMKILFNQHKRFNKSSGESHVA
jgi:hypothetical protein